VDYDPEWPARFAEARERLSTLLPAAEIHHIGSTAVPGLPAKPVIDIMALVDDLDGPIADLIEAGWEFPSAFNDELVNRRWLCRPNASVRTHHLHLVSDRHELERCLRFRDRLRADEDLASGYRALKRRLAAELGDDREAYTAAKAEFVRRAERAP
jgi:GrpB-like predicted nucleotidyltransferase (UPF0157 family)